MVILVEEFGLSIYAAAKVLDLTYINAKQMYRIYRTENRIAPKTRSPIDYGMSEQFLLRKLDKNRVEAAKKLNHALQTWIVGKKTRTEICDKHFDELICKQLLTEFELQGVFSMRETLNNRTLPIPVQTTVTPTKPLESSPNYGSLHLRLMA